MRYTHQFMTLCCPGPVASSQVVALVVSCIPGSDVGVDEWIKSSRIWKGLKGLKGLPRSPYVAYAEEVPYGPNNMVCSSTGSCCKNILPGKDARQIGRLGFPGK